MTITLPELNTGLLSQLVTWAVLDAQDVAKFNEQFAGWAHWNQNYWGRIESEGAQWFNGPNGDVVAFEDPNICGTAACMAGQAVVQMGQAFVFTGTNYEHATDCAPRIQLGVNAAGRMVWGPDPYAPRRSISGFAREVLGLYPSESNVLFDGDNNVNRIVGLANLFAQVRGVTLDVEPGILALGELDNPVGYDDGDENGLYSDVETIYGVRDLAVLDVRTEPNPHIAEWEARQNITRPA